MIVYLTLNWNHENTENYIENHPEKYPWVP